ncbi:MAG TPA: Asp23/Gls24 family envelope stress response protein [Firmicutes bacterium]|nr:Asp23/Gls24 family envelope stress response protein [Bacillota bacterium]
MEVYALVGRRGTGKSHHAQLLAHHYGINYLLDDGLLIKGSQILAGRSAKRENTRYGAIKRALLHDDEHARQLRDRLKELTPSKLLILATSERMAEVIAGRLEVPPPHRYIHIEDIASPEAIEKARQMRNEKNRHVIPLPTFSIKKEFPGYIVDPLRSFFRLPSPQRSNVAVERSIVRPVYSNLGNFYISEHVVSELVGYIAGAVPGVHKADRVEIATEEGKMILNVDLVFSLKSLPAKNLHRAAAEVQQRLKEQLEHLTGFYLDRINVTVKKIFPGEQLED